MAKLMKDAGHDGATGHTVTHSALQQAQRRREARPTSAGRPQEDVFTRLYKNSQFGARNHHRNKRQDMLRLLKVNDNPLELDASERAVFEQLRGLPTEGFEGFEAEFEGTEVPTPDATLGRTAPPTLGRVASAPQLKRKPRDGGGAPAAGRPRASPKAASRRDAARQAARQHADGAALLAVYGCAPSSRDAPAATARPRPKSAQPARAASTAAALDAASRRRPRPATATARQAAFGSVGVIRRSSARPASAGGARVVEGVSNRHTMRTTPARHSIVHHCCCAGVGCTSPQPDAASYEAGRRSIEQRVPPRRPVSAGPRSSGAAAAVGASVTAEDLFRGVGARVAVGARGDPARRRPARRKPPKTVADASEEALTAAVHKVMMASGADAPAVLLRVMSRLQPPVQEADDEDASAAAGPAPSASRPDLA